MTILLDAPASSHFATGVAAIFGRSNALPDTPPGCLPVLQEQRNMTAVSTLLCVRVCMYCALSLTVEQNHEGDARSRHDEMIGGKQRMFSRT